MNDKTKKERLNQLGNDTLVRWERTTCLPHMPFPSGAMHTGGAAVGLASALHGPPKFARTRPTFELFELYSPPARHESGLLAFVKRDEAESVVMREAYEMGLELRTAHTVYDPSLVWAHEAAKVAFRLITEARWAAFTCDPCPERLALYNASAAVCRTIRRNEREGW